MHLITVKDTFVHTVVRTKKPVRGFEPRRDEDVRTLLVHLETDRQQVAETDIEALEAEIDEAVYELFNLNESEREVVESYLDVF